MAIRQEQFRYTLGELDPKLYARADTEFYQSGAKTMTNLLSIPEGGFIARAGTISIDKLPRKLTRILTANLTATTPNGGTAASANDNDETTFLLTTTNLGTINPYVVVQYDLGASEEIKFIDVVKVTLTTAATSNDFYVQGSNDNVTWDNLGNITVSDTEATKRFLVDASYRYIRFAKTSGANLGAAFVSIGELNIFQNTNEISIAKRIDFVFNVDQTYIIFLTDQNISIYRNGVFQTCVRALEYTNDLLQIVYPIQSGDTALLFHEDIKPHALVRISDTEWTFSPVVFKNIPYFDFVPVINTPVGDITPDATDGKITITRSVSGFAPEQVNNYIDGNGGRARIVRYVSGTEIEAIVEIPFYNTDTIPQGSWEFLGGYEPEWSATRGWPRSAVFFQGRLFIGGSKSRPRTVYASRIGEFFDFDLGDSRPDDAFSFDIANEDPIVSIIANRNLQIFTTGGEITSIQSRNTALSVENFSVISQTRVGSEQGIKPVIVDGSTLFLKYNGHSIGKFLYTDVEQSYDVTNLTLLSSHLIKSPVDMAVRKVTNEEEASYLMIVNNDGTLTFGCILDEQSVKGFTPCITDGLYKNVATDNDVMYCVVAREIDGQEDLYLEQFDFSVDTDASKVYTTGLPTDTFTNLSHLEGKECRVYADGNILENVTVENGQVTVERDIETRGYIGLNIYLRFEPLPYRNLELFGAGLDFTYRLIKASVYVLETSSIEINGENVSFYGLTETNNPLDGVNPVYTGVVSVEGIQDDSMGATNLWTNSNVVITRPDPLPFKVLSISTVFEKGR